MRKFKVVAPYEPAGDLIVKLLLQFYDREFCFAPQNEASQKTRTANTPSMACAPYEPAGDLIIKLLLQFYDREFCFAPQNEASQKTRTANTPSMACAPCPITFLSL